MEILNMADNVVLDKDPFQQKTRNKKRICGRYGNGLSSGIWSIKYGKEKRSQEYKFYPGIGIDENVIQWAVH